MSAKFQGFAQGLGFGYGIVNKFQAARDQSELRKVADAKPEFSEGFTQEDGEKLRAAAESGQYDIGFDDKAGGYTVTPRSDPSQVGVIKQRGVTDFLGNRSEGKMSERQVDDARHRAMAGIVSRSDPVSGRRMMRDLERDAREDQRFEWEARRADREGRQFEREQANEEFEKSLSGEVTAFMKSRLGGQGGTPARPATMDDFIAASQFKVGKLMEAGQTEKAGKLIAELDAQAFTKIQLESKQRDEALAVTVGKVASGDLDAAKDFYNRFLPDGANVTSISRDPNGQIVIQRETVDGQKLPPTMLQSTDQMVATLATFKDPMAVYNWSQGELRSRLALAADARAGRAEGRAAARDQREQQTDAERARAGLNLFRENNPNATPAQLEAVRANVLPAAPPQQKPGSFKTEAGDITALLADPAMDAKGRPIMDPLTGRQVVNRNPARERALFQFMAENGITDTNEGIQRFIQSQQGGAPGPAGAPAPGTRPALQRGQIVNGYEYLGGDPNKQSSWRQVATGHVK